MGIETTSEVSDFQKDLKAVVLPHLIEIKRLENIARGNLERNGDKVNLENHRGVYTDLLTEHEGLFEDINNVRSKYGRDIDEDLKKGLEKEVTNLEAIREPPKSIVAMDKIRRKTPVLANYVADRAHEYLSLSNRYLTLLANYIGVKGVDLENTSTFSTDSESTARDFRFKQKDELPYDRKFAPGLANELFSLASGDGFEGHHAQKLILEYETPFLNCDMKPEQHEYVSDVIKRIKRLGEKQHVGKEDTLVSEMISAANMLTSYGKGHN